MADALNPQETEDQEIVDQDETPTGAESEGEAVENVIEDPDSQPGKVRSGTGYNRLVRRLGKAKAETRDVAGELEVERQKTKILELALEQKQEAKAPDPSAFDDGVSDPKFVEAQTAYIASLAAQEVKKNLPTPDRSVKSDDLERKQRAHAERAEALNIADYTDVQDAAIDTLGGDIVNEIIKASDRSEIILYYLGKNPGKAEDIRDLIATNPVRATLEIGRLDERLKVKPRATTQPIPDPDAEVQGGTPTAGQTNKFQKQLDKARAAAGETGNMRAILDIKKAAKEAGVTVN